MEKSKLGRGRKQCPNGHITGPRSRKCPECDHIFIIKSAKIKQHTPKPIAGPAPSLLTIKTKDRLHVILTPADRCPVPLKGSDKESVLAWKDKVREIGFERGHDYTDDALAYWVGADFFEPFVKGKRNPEYDKARSHLNPIYP